VLLFGALRSRRRRRVTALLAAPVAFLLFTAPGNVFNAGIPSLANVFDYSVWSVEATFHNRGLALPQILPAVVGTWLTLELLARLEPERRRGC
jgi:hypothetical protein